MIFRKNRLLEKQEVIKTLTAFLTGIHGVIIWQIMISVILFLSCSIPLKERPVMEHLHGKEEVHYCR